MLVLPWPAHADLYRWVDPATGSVKFSTLPPTDPRIEPDVVPYKAPPLPKPAAKPPAVVPPTVPQVNTAELEARWRALAVELSSLSPQDLKANSDRVRQQVLAYEATRAELDRLDPAGTARRNAEMAAMMQNAANKRR